MPVLDVVLDPVRPGDARRADPNPHGIPSGSSPERTAVRGLVAGLVVITATFIALFAADPSRGRFIAESARRLASPAASSSARPPLTASATPAPPVSAAPPIAPPQPIPGPWRLAQLATSPDIKVIEGTMDRRSFIEAVNSAGVPRGQVYRVLAAFNNVRKFDRSRRHDTFATALELPSRRVRAFEYQAGPTEIYQARERDDGSLVGERLDLHVEKKRASAAVVVGDELAASLQAAGLDPTLVDHLDDALEGRAQLSSLHPGSRLRIVADYETALGVFARYLDVLAIEYLSSENDAPALRVYRFRSERSDGYFDARGHQPFKGGFRSPIPFARISSGFNMHRMHPILHVVMPHNGVDFAASSGTPVYAACYGDIEWIGDAGASGNLVTIRHAGGITTGYAHLSRFAPHLAQGQAVETRQLIGYVGSTGRSTGPHLHFSTKKNGVFIDPLSLRLDGDKVLPKPERPAFEDQRAVLDKLIDAIPLPPAPPEASGHKAEPSEGDEPMEESH